MAKTSSFRKVFILLAAFFVMGKSRRGVIRGKFRPSALWELLPGERRAVRMGEVNVNGG